MLRRTLVLLLAVLILLSSVGGETILAVNNEFESENPLIDDDSFNNPESSEYQIWKENYFKENEIFLRSSKDDVPNQFIRNEYLEISVKPENGRFTIGTTGGNLSSDLDNNKKLLYGHPDPRTSYTTVSIDGTVYKYGDDEFVHSPSISGNSNISEVQYGDISIKQIISIVRNGSTLRDDIVEIKYEVENKGQERKDIGLRIMLDTMLGSNDACPFRIQGTGALTTEKEFVGNDIPQYWNAFDNLDRPNVVSYGNFLTGEITPNRVQFTNWANVYEVPWNYSVETGSSNGDSAVSIIWERTLDANQKEVYETRYGMSELLQDLRPPLALTISADSEVQLNNSKNGYLPYIITAYVQNTGNTKAINVNYNIELPNEMRLGGNDSEILNLGDIEVNEIKSIEKTIYVKQNAREKLNVPIRIKITAENTETKELIKRVKIPAVSKKAIIVVPGIAGTRLFSNQEISTKDYLPPKFDNEKYYFNFGENHMLWEPYSSTIYNIVEKATTKKSLIQTEALMLACDSTGNSQISMNTEEMDASEHGAQGTYTKLVKDLEKAYKNSEYDVIFFPYDWRMGCDKSSKKLERFINRKGYSDIVLVCHSMGGLVASSYINRSQANVEKVDKLITIGTPYLGAPKALYILETGHFLGCASNFVMSAPLKEVVNNFSSVYELLPPKQYFDLTENKYLQKSYYKKIKHSNRHKMFYKALNYQETVEEIAKRDWAKLSDGRVKGMIEDSKSFHDALFMDHSNHSINKVDSYLLIGNRKNTIMKVKQKYSLSGKYKGTSDIKILNSGDGTVPVVSANIGGNSHQEKTYYYKENHTGLVKNDKVISKVKSIINGKTQSHSVPDFDLTPNAKGWIGTEDTRRIMLRVACPINLTLENNGTKWAEATNEYIYNEDEERGNLYTLGEDNEIKIAYLNDSSNDVILIGTDTGKMDYVASIFDAGYEIERVIFRNIPITSTTKIFTNTDFESGLRLNIDEDGDGRIDKVILPNDNYVGMDLEEEIGEIEEPMSNYGLASKSKLMSMNLASKNLNVDSNLLSNGMLTVTSSNFAPKGIIDAKPYMLNARKQSSKIQTMNENLEIDLNDYIKKNPYWWTNIPDGKKIGRTTHILKNNYTIPERVYLEGNLIFTGKKIETENSSLIYSKTGNITITSDDIDIRGIIYAPRGTVMFTGKNINFDGVIIADTIYITGTDTVIKNTLTSSEFIEME